MKEFRKKPEEIQERTGGKYGKIIAEIDIMHLTNKGWLNRIEKHV